VKREGVLPVEMSELLAVVNPSHDPALPESRDVGRFAFGKNWLAYVDQLTAAQIERAERAILDMIGREALNGARFLDAGCGSGLFSLAAVRLGATVHSFDFDEHSVQAALVLKEKHAPRSAWTIDRGSVLDNRYLQSLGDFDVVYSWGVLHHTGDMWRALENVAGVTRPSGKLCIAIYNDQGLASDAWRIVKRLYNALPDGLRFVVFWPACVRLWAPTFIRDGLRGHPLKTWRAYGVERGMSPLVDLRDWVGGYPFEVASPTKVTDFYTVRGFELMSLVRRTGIGCNEFVFRKS
jgi:2-polyprenyl-6-hydroxyphenyl methylase/3-demethylubiquinone-9 3-methyltransferase